LTITSPINVEQRQALIDHAMNARQNAYAPYSHYKVGAALLASDGTIFLGCNVENAAYPVGICAERTAVVKAVSEGAKKFIAIAVVTEDGGSPCGMCRQTLNEFSPEIWVIAASGDGTIVFEQSLHQMLPHGFGPANLNVDPEQN
jgi:cytidine deaminase